MNLKRLILPSVLVLSLALSIEVSRSIAQAVPPSGVSEPEPTPNPVKEQTVKPKEEGGIDPELGQIAEPDAPDVVLEGTGADNAPKIEGGVDDQNRTALESIINKESTTKANGEIMPKLVGADVPTIPIGLLFPNGGTSAVDGKITRVKELVGTNVLLYGLNRLTGKSLTFRLNVGQTLNYENLSVSLSTCYRSAPSEPDESWAYVDVIDKGAPPIQQIAVLAQRDRSKLKELVGPKKIRKGWMIASSPNVTAIDHPIYDLTLISCDGGAASAAPIKEASNTLGQKKENPADEPEKPVDQPNPPIENETPAAAPPPAPIVEEKAKQ